MGFWDKLLGRVDPYDPAQRVLPDPYEPYMATRGIPVMDPGTPLEYWHRTQVNQVWREQPNVRKVVDFIARSVASIPLHVYERVTDEDRQRLSGHPLAELLSSPRPGVGPYRFWHSVISDGLLYDRWVVLKRTDSTTGRPELVQIPSWRVRFLTDELRRVVGIKYWTGNSGLLTDTDEGWVDLPLDQVIYDHGYAPYSSGLSPLETLQPILRETQEAIAYRDKMWANGARVPAYVHRPLDAPDWVSADRNRFVNGLRQYRQGGAAEGGWPLLEDGMEIRQLNAFASEQMLDLDGRTLNAVEVCTAFHIAPELLGIRPANYGAMRELRSALYRDALGPYIDAWVQAVDRGLTPDFSQGRKLYIEPHVEAKLRGSFEEQALISQAVVGAPTMTRNEYRARNNLSPVEGGDELITPLNVTLGGLASPRDTGSQNRVPNPVRDDDVKAGSTQRKKEGPTESELDSRARLLSRFLDRQGRAVLSRISAGTTWWDAERWDAELADVLMSIHLLAATSAGRGALEKLGIDPEEYDEPRTLKYLRTASELSAASMNQHTHDAVVAALDDPDSDPASVFSDAGRAMEAAVTATTFASGFGTTEAARQQAPTATKTWNVTSSNPRSSHLRLDGETVGLDEDFSNGLPWPGAAGSDADEVAGCKCTVTINIP